MTEIKQGDVLEIIKTLPDNCLDAMLTDPPYGLSFMGKGWDTFKSDYSETEFKKRGHKNKARQGRAMYAGEYDQSLRGHLSFQEFMTSWAKETLRVMKPGAFCMVFGGTRTWHRLAVAIEDAGFEIKDTLMWLHGMGFPKSFDISKGIDKEAGIWRGRAGEPIRKGESLGQEYERNLKEDPATPVAKTWQGYGTALKPSWESILLIRKPLDLETERRIIVENLINLEVKLWSLLSANVAEKNFGLSQAEHSEVCASVQWSVEEKSSIQDGLLGQMDMSQSEEVLTSCLNTVLSWRPILDVLLNNGKTSIIKTETDKTIDFKTLNSCLSVLTPYSIIKAEIPVHGLESSVLTAVRYLNAVALNIDNTQELSALETAISKGSKEDLPLRPNWSPIFLIRKPLDKNNVNNALTWGTGGLNIDGGRIETKDDLSGGVYGGIFGNGKKAIGSGNKGRFPANLILDEESAGLLDEQSGELHGAGNKQPIKYKKSIFGGTGVAPFMPLDRGGGASRFFYCAKASRSEREAGLEGFEEKPGGSNVKGYTEDVAKGLDRNRPTTNHHPTVKPLSLCKYLATLLLPPPRENTTNGNARKLFVPFSGSGSEMIGGLQAGWDSVTGIEIDSEYIKIANARIVYHLKQERAKAPLFAEAIS